MAHGDHEPLVYSRAAMTASLRELTRGLSEVARLSARPDDVDVLLRRSLDALADAIPYDLAAILERAEDGLRVRCARGPLASERVVGHRVPISPGSAVERALESRRARVMGAEEHAEGFDPYHGVVDLPDGHGCMVVPLVAADEVLGAMTFDRSHCDTYDSGTVDIATIYGQLVALALVAARHASSLAKEKSRLEEENRLLSAETRKPGAMVQLETTRCLSMHRVVELARQVAVTEAPVLVTGETGTGKEVLARAIHEQSPRAERPFVKINCAALPGSLIESELFGHVKGAFSGADRDRPGRFSVADGGTLLLDEIGELPLTAQAKLLRVLQEGTFEHVGSDDVVTVDVRVLAATHVDLAAAIETGAFRQDLYYRLGLFPIHIPPLRERVEDIVPMCERVLASIAQKSGRGPWEISEAARARLVAHRWPGNVRELINVLERATILSRSGVLDEELVLGTSGSAEPEAPASPLEGLGAGETQWPTLEAVETEYLRRSLERVGGKIYGEDGAAALVGMKPTTLQSRLAKRGLARRAKH